MSNKIKSLQDIGERIPTNSTSVADTLPTPKKTHKQLIIDSMDHELTQTFDATNPCLIESYYHPNMSNADKVFESNRLNDLLDLNDKHTETNTKQHIAIYKDDNSMQMLVMVEYIIDGVEAEEFLKELNAYIEKGRGNDTQTVG